MPKCIELLPCDWLISHLCYQANWTGVPNKVSVYIYIYIFFFFVNVFILSLGFWFWVSPRKSFIIMSSCMFSPWSSERRSSRGLCIQWSPWPAPAQWSTGSATGCALPWCAPQTSPFYYQTCLSPDLGEHAGNPKNKSPITCQGTSLFIWA